MGAISLLFSILGFLGTFGISKPGIAITIFSTRILGRAAWLSPYIFLAITFYLWVYSWYRTTDVQKESATGRYSAGTNGTPLPATRLVSFKGFNQYFTSEKWSEVEAPPQDEIRELGKDFPSYFGEGEFAAKPSVNLSNLRGFRTYFEQVQEEFWQEHTTQEQTNEEPEETIVYPGQVANLVDLSAKQVEKNRGNLNGVTSEEREILLGKPKSSLASGPGRLQGVVWTEKGLADQTVAPVPERIGPENIAIPEGSVIERKKKWILPPLEILEDAPIITVDQDTETPKRLEGVLQDFGVKAKVIRVTRGPVITRYELAPAPGVKISRIVNLADDMALALAAKDIRIEAPIPGKGAIGIEIPNKQSRAVTFREVIDTTVYRQNTSKLKVALGKDLANQAIVGDLSKMPHLLVAGATGSGKSVCITSIINSVLCNANPDEVKFLLVDPKMVELNQYNGIPHLLAPVVTDPQKAATALKWIVKEMENRYELFAAAGVRDIERFNLAKLNSPENLIGTLPWIVVIIDELADLMLVAPGDVEEAICRLAQMARAAGIHLVIATQRPSVDVITGVIKANIPSRISFAVSSQIDSRTILDSVGAEKLIGKGDMLYSPLGMGKPIRVQGCLVTDEEVDKIIVHWKGQGKPEYLDPVRLFAEVSKKSEENNKIEDELFVDAGRLLITSGMASVTFLQRRLKLGYARAARLIDMLEEQGIVGPYEGSKPRLILVSIEEFVERYG
ncbi:MAG: DNA translocase FtsK [Desulfitobacteriaceae bacterium]